ncbi:hypothetical protein K435DRAFT_777365 [Dendrothele bispora CBS 962.96]|uniref:Heterokaryon incompatibility domain-containing protein n=1 Tax=Dendrothele bispora (strain CBS 962.96) TaxID=1314807 RepID=A0A4S8M8B2_DENBC|nr:hypothetical protein K435DRAFT_777365 [Dendrothele bispora CBS 962.96]
MGQKTSQTPDLDKASNANADLTGKDDIDSDGGEHRGQVDVSASFQSLVKRSIAAWPPLVEYQVHGGDNLREDFLQKVKTLQSLLSVEDLLSNGEFWFFQLRESFMKQSLLTKWDPNNLEAYILLPLSYGFVNNQDCFFVSHYWRSREHPDPTGHDMDLFREDMNSLEWSYVWVDWTCMPQNPRTKLQQRYFRKMLQFIPPLVRDCAFEWRFATFEPRAWILSEVAEYVLNHKEYIITDDMKPFLSHLTEMFVDGVQPVISRHKYACTNGSDMRLLIGWLEVLVILFKIVPDTSSRQSICDMINRDYVGSYFNTELGLRVDKYKGVISYKGFDHNFTPVFDPSRYELDI